MKEKTLQDKKITLQNLKYGFYSMSSFFDSLVKSHTVSLAVLSLEVGLMDSYSIKLSADPFCFSILSFPFYT